MGGGVGQAIRAGSEPEVLSTISLAVVPGPLLASVLRFPDRTIRIRLGTETRGYLLSPEQILGLRGLLADCLAVAFEAERNARSPK